MGHNAEEADRFLTVKLTIDFNTADFRAAAQDAVRVLKADAPQFIREEVRLFVKEYMKMTAPMAAFGKSVGGKADYQAGVNAIKGDLAQVAGHADYNYLTFVSDTFGQTQIKQQLYKKGSSKPYLIDWDKVAFDAESLRRHHRSKMNAYGRPPNHFKMGSKKYGSAEKTIGRWVATEPIIVPHAMYESYLARLIDNIGSAKAAFNAALFATAATGIPPWVKKHGGRGTYAESGSGEQFNATITGRTEVPYAQRTVDMAIALRGKKLTAEIKRIMAGFAKTGKILTRRKSFNETT